MAVTVKLSAVTWRL